MVAEEPFTIFLCPLPRHRHPRTNSGSRSKKLLHRSGDESKSRARSCFAACTTLSRQSSDGATATFTVLRTTEKHWGVPDSEDLNDESKVQLATVLEAEGDSMIYVYDFGDNWRHEVLLEKIVPANDPTKIPICLDGESSLPTRRCGWCFRLRRILGNYF